MLFQCLYNSLYCDRSITRSSTCFVDQYLTVQYSNLTSCKEIFNYFFMAQYFILALAHNYFGATVGHILDFKHAVFFLEWSPYTGRTFVFILEHRVYNMYTILENKHTALWAACTGWGYLPTPWFICLYWTLNSITSRVTVSTSH